MCSLVVQVPFQRYKHTKAAMTLAKAPDEESKPFPIVEWTESRYYFNGKMRRRPS